jgi:hypothetical protein
MPAFYGIRLEYLDMELSKDEQLSFFASQSDLLRQLPQALQRLESTWLNPTSPETRLPLEELREFKSLLETIAGPRTWPGEFILTNQYGMQRLHVPLYELREFAKLLELLCGPGYGLGEVVLTGRSPISRLRVPLHELQEFAQLLERLSGANYSAAAVLSGSGTIRDLRVPRQELREYRDVLDDILAKLRLLPKTPGTPAG